MSWMRESKQELMEELGLMGYKLKEGYTDLQHLKSGVVIFRLAKGISQKEFAGEMGFSLAEIQKIESKQDEMWFTEEEYKKVKLLLGMK